MKLFKESPCEIRIQLSKADLDFFNTSIEELDYTSDQGKRVILELFARAKREMGFQTDGEKIYVQLFPKKGGGCELFITKLEREKARTCFYFSDFDALYSALSAAPLPKKWDLWRNKTKGSFYVLLPPEEIPPLFLEFGEQVKTPSPIFLKSGCQKTHWEERLSNG